MDTKKEVENMIKNGMEKLTLSELKQTLEKLGYEINKDNSFRYINAGNANSYKAYSCNIVDKKSKKSFSNTESKRDNDFIELQALRFKSFVYSNGYIYEL